METFLGPPIDASGTPGGCPGTPGGTAPPPVLVPKFAEIQDGRTKFFPHLVRMLADAGRRWLMLADVGLEVAGQSLPLRVPQNHQKS